MMWLPVNKQDRINTFNFDGLLSPLDNFHDVFAMSITVRRSSLTISMFTSNLFSFFLLHMLLFLLPLHRCSAGTGCLEVGSMIDDINNSTLVVSPGNIFELGFFTPDKSITDNRYLGIWYKNYTGVKIVVWVANRDNPLLESNGSFTVGHGKARLLDKHGQTCWSAYSATAFDNPSPTISNLVIHDVDFRSSNGSHGSGGKKAPSFDSTTLCLHDTGNLILQTGDQYHPLRSWQSFDHPTDTFLPGMDASGNLTSWQSLSTPAPGNFTLLILSQSILKTVGKTGVTYWENQDTPVKEIPQKLKDVLQGNASALTRLVIDFTGQVRLWEWDSSTGWHLKWFEPKDRCSYNVCGDFGSCNGYNGLLCKCLPGFTPNEPAKWDAGEFSSGCSSKLQSCMGEFSHDTFLKLPLMKVETKNSDAITNQDCKTACLSDCNCAAYASDAAKDAANLTGTDAGSNCIRWMSAGLADLQEGYAGGITLHVRIPHSDTALNSRDCGTCGTYSIPYPLSTSASCGDPSYLYFLCNTSTGQVVFSTYRGKFNVTYISQDANTFSIQVPRANSCDSRTLESNGLSNIKIFPFNVRNCNKVTYQPLMEVHQPFIEVEIGWQPPHEPVCNASSGCGDWPHTTCKAAKGGKMRCVCSSSFKWDGTNLKCITVFPVKVLIACIAAALAIVSLVGVVVIYCKRRSARETGSVELKGDDSERIDLPFFDWESILLATNNFADDKKLGTGGFGSVYMGNLPNKEKIAVKRLSSVSVQGVEEFRTEVLLIAKLQHRNLVRLLGYCVKADEKILVYEYMPNGSLDACLFDETLSVNLDWEKRFDIISGIARGLLYLHHDSRLRIIHRDLKPSNILLDDDLNPKISDFGIARIVEGKQTESSTKRVVGTYGYMSPEYALEGIFSVKSDVFSFGVVVLETLAGRRNSRIFIYEHGLSLLGHAWKLWSEDRGMELADRTLRDSCNISEMLKCIQIALLCIQEDPSDRPTMSTVVLMLSSENASLPPPKQPAFSTRKPHLETTSSSSAVELSSNDLPFTVSTVGR